MAKKNIKRLFALVLAVSMVMSLSVNALAVGPIKEYRCKHTDDACYEMVLDCEKHVHDSTCGDPCDQEVLDFTCTKEEHIHVENCFGDVLTCNTLVELTCTEAEHTHNEACMHQHEETCPVYDCEPEACVEEHVHDEACEHQHNEECIAYDCGMTAETLVCETEIHEHADECYTSHAHEAACYETGLVCEFEAHTHGNNCYAPHEHTAECMTRGELICTLDDLPNDLETATCAESGIDFNLYNYNGEINLVAPYAESGKKFTTLSQYFNFGGGGTGTQGGSPGVYGTSTKAIGQLDKGHFTYERNLGKDGAPVITWASVDNLKALEATEARSIGYVFGKTDHFAVTAYEDIENTPLSYDRETGYYEYNSADTAVDFDIENDWLYTRGYKDQGKSSADSNVYFDGDDSLADFFPFNSRIQTGADGEVTFVQDSEDYMVADGTYYHYDTSSKTPLKNPDYWFGANMHASFYYPQGGYLNDEPMTYEFSGDDDVMVYIDNIFLMDLGGGHSRASGEIDFATGLVETWLDAANQPALYPAEGPYDHREWAAEASADGTLKSEDGFYYAEGLLIRYYPTTIYECYKAAYEEQGLDADEVAAKLAEVFVKIDGETVEDAYGNEHDVYRFRDYSVHTFDWFYLERHGFEANFYTKFNLPTLPTYTVTYIDRDEVVQETEDLVTGDEIPGCEDPEDYEENNAKYTFKRWKLIEGKEGKNGTVGTTDLVYEAVYQKAKKTSDITPSNPEEDIDIPDDDIPLADIPELFGDDHFAYIIGRDDGLVHPEANITRAEVATIFFRLLAEEVRTALMTDVNDFSDVDKGQWYNHAVSTLSTMGIVLGRDDGTYYDPDAFITRAEFAAIAARFDPTGNPEGVFFSDIEGHWAEREIIIAANNGWVEGYNGLFRPDDYITRAEAMTLVNRVLHRLPETEEDLLDYMVIWPDNMDVEAWYYLAVQEATNSHFYVRKTDPVYESWTEFREPYDWSLLEY